MTPQTTRSGGTSPIRNVIPIASRRKVKTWRRRSRARARLPFGLAHEPHALAGGHDPTAFGSVRLRLRQELHPALDVRPHCRGRPLPRRLVGTKNATHMMPNAGEEQPIQPSLPWGRGHATPQHLGWAGTLAPHLGSSNHIDVIRRTFSQAALRTSRVHVDRCMPVDGLEERRPTNGVAPESNRAR